MSSLAVVANGGALLTPYVKQRLIEALPNAVVVDGVGSSETGAQMHHMSTSGAVATGTFNAGPDTFVAAEDLTAILRTGPRRHGLAGAAGLRSARLQGRCGQDGQDISGDRRRAVRRSPVTARATAPTARIELLGRDSVTINSGGEKIFVEEVETAIASHPAVADVVVAGRPSERWGQEVVAVVALADGRRRRGRGTGRRTPRRSLARYKLPKAIVFRPVIERSPSGKADYRWAREQAVNG